jgi:hypothetical protein
MTDIFKIKPLSSAAVDVLEQLFVKGPTWDGYITSKAGRGDLVDAGLAFHENGWASLTAEGIRLAVSWDRNALSKRYYQGWIEKLRAS